MGDWFQDPKRISKSSNAQVPYIKWYTSMHTVETTDPLVESADAKPGDTKCPLYTYGKKICV